MLISHALRGRLKTRNEDRERWRREAQMAIDGAQQGRSRNKVLARAKREIALCRDVDRVVAALEALSTAGWAYAALQDSASDPRVGVVQPITVADGNALQAALVGADELLREPPQCAQAEG